MILQSAVFAFIFFQTENVEISNGMGDGLGEFESFPNPWTLQGCKIHAIKV